MSTPFSGRSGSRQIPSALPPPRVGGVVVGSQPTGRSASRSGVGDFFGPQSFGAVPISASVGRSTGSVSMNSVASPVASSDAARVFGELEQNFISSLQEWNRTIFSFKRLVDLVGTRKDTHEFRVGLCVRALCLLQHLIVLQATNAAVNAHVDDRNKLSISGSQSTSASFRKTQPCQDVEAHGRHEKDRK